MGLDIPAAGNPWKIGFVLDAAKVTGRGGWVSLGVGNERYHTSNCLIEIHFEITFAIILRQKICF